MSFVPDGFDPPLRLDTGSFRLEPLGAEHNERDHQAWMSSIDHIRSTPGYPDGNWPSTRTLQRNLEDLEKHAREFAQRVGFTYSVLDGDDVIGCVYIYPTDKEGHDAQILSWVTERRSELDRPLWEAVSAWLVEAWPFTNPYYAAR